MARMDTKLKEQVTAAFNLGKFEGEQVAEKKYRDEITEAHNQTAHFKRVNAHLNRTVSDLDRDDPIGGIVLTIRKAACFARIFRKFYGETEGQNYLQHAEFLENLIQEPTNAS